MHYFFIAAGNTENQETCNVDADLNEGCSYDEYNVSYGTDSTTQ